VLKTKDFAAIKVRVLVKLIVPVVCIVVRQMKLLADHPPPPGISTFYQNKYTFSSPADINETMAEAQKRPTIFAV